MDFGTRAVRQWSRYLTPTASHRRLGLVCLGVGQQSGPVPPCRGRVLDLYAAVLLVRGKGTLRWGDPPTARLNQAKLLLAESDAAVAAVAAVGRVVGYDDPAYFTRVFARRTGVPPRAFRERQRRIPTSDDESG